MLKQRALFSLFIALILSVLLHVSDIPYWAMALCAGVMIWRFLAFKGAIGFPNIWLKAGLVITGFYGVFYSYGTQLSIEGMVTLLVAGVALKPLEVQKTAESYLLVFLCFLLQGMHFLFDQTPLHYFYVLVCFVFTIYALIAVNQNESLAEDNSRRPVGLALQIFFLSLPLAIFLFFILPRLGPLWAIKMSTQSGIVGLSSSMSPGDLSSLARNTELAFRVSFNGRIPAPGEFYWRAVVLDKFDGTAWEQSQKSSVRWFPMEKTRHEPQYEYEIIAQPQNNNWLYALTNSLPATYDVGVNNNGMLRKRGDLNGPLKYQAISYRGVRQKKVDLSKLERMRSLQLPDSINPKARELASTLAGDKKDLGEINARFQQYFYSQPYGYTLSPGLLSSDSRVDEFLFESQKGFCAHYASAYVFMMRSLGIPSRVIGGYLGGERNSAADYYSVYQYDAHAWAEVWDDVNGWIRVDPTAWVAPERVELGIEYAVDDFVGFQSNSKWIKDLRAQMQALNFYWQDWMLSYKGDRQQQLLDSLWGKRSPMELFLMIAVGFAITIGLVFLVFFWGAGERKSRIQNLHELWLKRLNKKGVSVSPSESLDSVANKTIALNEQMETRVRVLSRELESLIYARKRFELNLWRVIQLRRTIRKITK